MNVACWQLNIFGRSLRGSTTNNHTECTANCMTTYLRYVGRPGETSESRLLLLWTKAAMMLDWGRSTLDITTAGIVGISYCCMLLCIALCWWQCLLTVSWNLLPHIVTPLDVTTVAWCSRQTQDVLHPAECPPTNITVPVDSTCLHYLISRRKLQQSVYWRLVPCHTQGSIDR